MPRRTLIRFVLAVVGVALVECAVLLPINWFGTQGSKEAGPIDTLMDVMIVLSSVVFAVVMVALVYVIWAFRAKPGDESDGEPIHGNTRLEIIWTLIPTLIVLFGAGYSWAVLNDIEKKDAGRLVVNVTAEQFAWHFEYPGQKVTSDKLVVPINRQVEFRLRSKDVIHSFWVPAWRIKRDVVPGLKHNEIVVTPNRAGAYPLVCTEYCGVGHPTMRGRVAVMSKAGFERWVTSQGGAQGGAQPPTGGGGGGGQGPGGASPADVKVFTDAGCSSCHTLAEAKANGTVGPDLDQTLKGKDKAFIERSILDPGAFVEKGFDDGIMPKDYKKQLSRKQLDALVRLLLVAAKG